MKTHRHYGVLLDTEEPTTGVYNGNDLELSYIDDYIDPDIPEDAEDDELMFWESSTLLYGDWKQDSDGLWEPNRSGEYAAIHNVNYNTVQVIWSKFVRYGIMCSPCYPGQVDAQLDDPASPDDKHFQAYYAMPNDLLRQD